MWGKGCNETVPRNSDISAQIGIWISTDIELMLLKRTNMPLNLLQSLVTIRCVGNQGIRTSARSLHGPRMVDQLFNEPSGARAGRGE